MRLRLTLEYDGTGFRGWAAQPGLRTVEGVLQEALSDVFAAGRSSRSRAAPIRACTRSPRSPRSRSRAARRPSARPPALNAEAARRRGRRAPQSRRRRTSTRATRSRAQLPLPGLPPRRALAVRGAALVVVSAPARRGAARRVGRPAARRARLPRLHADRDAAQGLHANGRVRGLAPARATRSSSRSRRTRSCATWCGRSSARWSSSPPRGAAAAARGRATAATQARPPRRGASTWFPSVDVASSDDLQKLS